MAKAVLVLLPGESGVRRCPKRRAKARASTITTDSVDQLPQARDSRRPVGQAEGSHKTTRRRLVWLLARWCPTRNYQRNYQNFRSSHIESRRADRRDRATETISNLLTCDAPGATPRPCIRPGETRSSHYDAFLSFTHDRCAADNTGRPHMQMDTQNADGNHLLHVRFVIITRLDCDHSDPIIRWSGKWPPGGFPGGHFLSGRAERI
jgi:hypothetical protein